MSIGDVIDENMRCNSIQRYSFNTLPRLFTTVGYDFKSNDLKSGF